MHQLRLVKFSIRKIKFKKLTIEKSGSGKFSEQERAQTFLKSDNIV